MLLLAEIYSSLLSYFLLWFYLKINEVINLAYYIPKSNRKPILSTNLEVFFLTLPTFLTTPIFNFYKVNPDRVNSIKLIYVK